MANAVGVDVGSQSVKAVCIDESGRTLSVVSTPLSTRHPNNGWAEQSPQQWTDQLVAAIRQIPPGERAEVRALGVASQLKV